MICEIVNDDGTMARVPDLIRFCQKHGLVMVTVADLARYRLESDDEASLALLELDGVRVVSETKRNNERKTKMSVVQTVESGRASGRQQRRSGRLFVLDLSGDRVFSVNPDGSGKKIVVEVAGFPMASSSMSMPGTSTGPTWAFPI